MNKQEVIEKIEASKYSEFIYEFDGWKEEKFFNRGLDCALFYVKQLDELEKPVVPQFVADWYETNKYSLERNIYTLCIRSYQNELTEKEFAKWFDDVRNKAIETLVKMKVYGYEVEKEKLYTVEFPNPNREDVSLVLGVYNGGKVAMFANYSDDWKYKEQYQLTEAEIKKDFDWALQFAEEVEE